MGIEEPAPASQQHHSDEDVIFVLENASLETGKVGKVSSCSLLTPAEVFGPAASSS